MHELADKAADMDMNDMEELAGKAADSALDVAKDVGE
jgi:hypothetical protein